MKKLFFILLFILLPLTGCQFRGHDSRIVHYDIADISITLGEYHRFTILAADVLFYDEHGVVFI